MNEPLKMLDADFLDKFRKECESSKIGSVEKMLYLIGVEILERLDILVQQKHKGPTGPTGNTGTTGGDSEKVPTETETPKS